MKILAALLAVMAYSFTFIPGTGAENMKTLTMHTLTGEEANYDVATRRMSVMIVDRETLYTVERPWLPNLAAPNGVGGGVPNESAVPLGEYDLVLRNSPSQGWQWHLVNPELHVHLAADDRQHDWERFSCMFHVANYVHQVIGCIAPGESLWESADHGLSVGHSGNALRVIKEYLAGEREAKLRII